MNGKKTNVSGNVRRFGNRFQDDLDKHRKPKIKVTPEKTEPPFKFPYASIPRILGSIIFSYMTWEFINLRMPFILKSFLPPNWAWREGIATPLSVLIAVLLCLFSIWFSLAFERTAENKIKLSIKLAILIGVTFAAYVLFTVILGNAPLYAFNYSVWTMLLFYLFGESIRQLLLEKKIL